MSRDLDEAAAASAGMERDTTLLPDAWEAAPNTPTPMTDAENEAATARVVALQRALGRDDTNEAIATVARLQGGL